MLITLTLISMPAKKGNEREKFPVKLATLAFTFSRLRKFVVLTFVSLTCIIYEMCFSLQGLTIEQLQQVSSSIQRALHIRDEQMAWVDACCLQFTVKNKEGREKETLTFQTSNPVIKKDWIVGQYT